ncbi:hypothetical protein WJX72_010692 [[Myrmecia] bisecta]|uniref:RRM domain-containing protein n=1 Tax=[Myrmecia] bisecta TaxID=41462 RepID=A0AAW1QSQ1_9CHLO
MLPGNLPTQPVGRLSDAEGPAIIHIEGVPLAVQEADLHSSLVEGGIQGYLRVQMIQRPDHAFGMANATFETRFDAERAVIRLQEMFQWNHDNNNWVPTCIQIKMRTNLLDMATRLARIKALDDAAKDLIEDDIASGDADHGSELGSPRAHDGGTPRGDKRKAPEDGPEDGGGPSKRRRVIIPADGDAAAGGPLPPPPPPPATDPGTDWQRIIEANLQQ